MIQNRHLGSLGFVVALSLGFAGCDFIANLGNDGLGNARLLGATDTASTTSTTSTKTKGSKKTKGTDTGTTTTGTSTTGTDTNDTGTTKKTDPCPVDPKTEPLGGATDHNLFVFNDYDAIATDVGGTVAVGGNMTVSSFGTGSALLDTFKGVSLSVGDDLSYANGQVFQGDVEVGGTFTNPGPGGFSVPNGTNTDGVKGVFDAGDYEADMLDIADHLTSLTTNGTWSERYGQVELTGTDADLNVFELDLDAIKDQWATDSRYTHWAPSAVNRLTIDAPAGSTVVVNVVGDTSVFFQAHGIYLVGVTGDSVIYNFNDPKLATLVLAASPVYGSILAPHSTIEFDNTQMHGQMIAPKVTGTGELHELSFAGDICEDDTKKKKKGDTGTKSTDTGSSTSTGKKTKGKKKKY